MQHASMNINYMGQRLPVHTGSKTFPPHEKVYDQIARFLKYDILQN